MFSIYKATIKDIDKVVTLRMALQRETGEISSIQEEKIMRGALKTYLEIAFLNDEFLCYLAEANEEVIGSSGVVLFKRPPYLENIFGIEAYVMNIYTIPVHRGKGVATELLEKCIQDCEENGVRRIWLHSSKEGKSLYMKRGFSHNESEMELFL